MQNSGGVATAGGALVIVGGDGSACVSDDLGRTWTMHSVGGAVSSSEVLEVDGELWVYGGGRRYRSLDGRSWTSETLSPAGVSIGAVTRGPSGTLVAVNGGWNQWYDAQRFYRSEDGVRWEELPRESYRGGHPIFQIRHGWATPSAHCPAR